MFQVIRIVIAMMLFVTVAQGAIICESKTQKGKRLITQERCPDGYVRIGGSLKKQSSYSSSAVKKDERSLPFKAYFGKTLLSNVKIWMTEDEGDIFHFQMDLSEGKKCVRGEVNVSYIAGAVKGYMIIPVGNYDATLKTVHGQKRAETSLDMEKLKVKGVGYRCLERPKPVVVE